jgi:hypothetical protein
MAKKKTPEERAAAFEKKLTKKIATKRKKEGVVGTFKTEKPEIKADKSVREVRLAAETDSSSSSKPVKSPFGTKKKKVTAPGPTRKRKTKSGLPLDKKTGKVKTTKAGTLVSNGDGTVRQVSTEEERAQRTVKLPDAPVVREEERAGDTVGAVKSKMVGGGVSHQLLHGLIGQARTHLGRMASTLGTEEFHGHHESFNQVHATVAAGDHQLGTALGIARHAVMNPHHPDSKSAFSMSNHMISERLGQIKDMEGYRQEQGNKSRAERIAAYKAEKEGSE